VNAIASRRETRACEYYKKKGHIAKNYRSKKKATEDKDSFALNMGCDKDITTRKDN
jgi:hypothetical protein